MGFTWSNTVSSGESITKSAIDEARNNIDSVDNNIQYCPSFNASVCSSNYGSARTTDFRNHRNVEKNGDDSPD
jgi:hypothetical protein